jgi:hypothetical protein
MVGFRAIGGESVLLRMSGVYSLAGERTMVGENVNALADPTPAAVAKISRSPSVSRR